MHFFILPVLQTLRAARPTAGTAPNTGYGLEISESAY